MAKEVNLTQQLKHYFGFDTFKGDQEAIIRNLLEGTASRSAMWLAFVLLSRLTVSWNLAEVRAGLHGAVCAS